MISPLSTLSTLQLRSAIIGTVAVVSIGVILLALHLRTPAHATDYRQIWRDTFVAYQTGTMDIPHTGSFDFVGTLMVAGDTDHILRFSSVELGEPLSNFSIHIFGKYDFADHDHPSATATIQAYLNKRNFGLGDLDMSVTINGSGSATYTLDHLDSRMLDLFGITDPNRKDLIALFQDHAGKPFTTDAQSSMIRDVLDTIQSAKDPLYQNTKSQEAQIIQSFLDRDVIRISTGSQLPNSTARLTFQLDPANAVAFLNTVGKILGNGNENKDFGGDKTLFDHFPVSGTMDIRDHRLVDSIFSIGMPLRTHDKKTNTDHTDTLVLRNELKMPNPSHLDIDLTTKISSESTPANQLQIRIQ